MIAISVEGRMGNQLFQYAFGYAASRKMKCSFYIDKTYRDFTLPHYFETPFSLLSILDNTFFSIKGFNNFFTLKCRIYFYNKLLQVFTKRTFLINVDDSPAEVTKSITDNTRYKGYCQSEKYFIDYKYEICKIFQIKKKYTYQFQSKFGALFKENKTCTIHIRRTDYFISGHDLIGGENIVLPIEYYWNIINLVKHKVDRLIFISDDIASTKAIFGELENALFSEENLIIDMQLMMNADICVIANSTFSWWAAYLNNKPEKVIIAPKYFLGFKVKIESPKDIYPGDWIQIDPSGPVVTDIFTTN